MRVPLTLLRCPADGRPLELHGESLVCEGGLHRYPVVAGAPVLIDDSRSIFTASEVAASAGPGRRAPLLERVALRLRPSPCENPGSAERIRRFVELVCSRRGGANPARVLVVGGGVLGAGMEAIATDPRLEVIDADVYLSERVAVACDAHQLPFPDGVFDGVVIQAVLEHVASPPDAVAEIHRVLDREGLVYAETPFLQAVHEGAYDFTRYTDIGHRRLFRMFEQVDRGVALGPANSLFWALRYFARALPRRGGLAVRLLDLAVWCSTSWLVLLDRRLNDHDGALDAACGVYFLGRRADTPVSDREIVASYRGTAGRQTAQARGFRA